MRILIYLLSLATSLAYGSDFETFPETRVLAGVLQFPLYSFYLGAPDVNGVAYLPNFSPRLGPQFAWDGFGGTVTLALPLPQEERERRGDSHQTMFVLRHFKRRYAFDVYYQRTQGFYIDSPWSEMRTDKPSIYSQLPEAVATHAGINSFYVFSPDKYSLAAAYELSEFQQSSGGSYLLQGFYDHLEISLGSKFLLGTDPSGPQQMPSLKSGTFDTGGAAFGYGYNYVRCRYFVAGHGALGVGLQYQNILRPEESDLKQLSLAGKVTVGAATGYNGPVWMYGLRFLLDSLMSRVHGTDVASSLILGELFVGARF